MNIPFISPTTAETISLFAASSCASLRFVFFGQTNYAARSLNRDIQAQLSELSAFVLGKCLFLIMKVEFLEGLRGARGWLAR
jgi:hypothetical protein